MGVDAVIAQGGEGGGHTGTVPTSLLLPDVVDAVGAEIPVLGAGGFHDGRGLVAALAYGADGIAMGTRFLLTQNARHSHVLDAGVWREIDDWLDATLPRPSRPPRPAPSQEGAQRAPAGTGAI